MIRPGIKQQGSWFLEVAHQLVLILQKFIDSIPGCSEDTSMPDQIEYYQMAMNDS